MFARLADVPVKPGKRNEWLTILTNEYQPLVQTQPGFVDFVGLTGDTDAVEAITLTLWATKRDADRFYSSHEFKTIMERITPMLAGMTVRTFNVEASTSHKVVAAAVS